jgi:acyl carrier protein
VQRALGAVEQLRITRPALKRSFALRMIADIPEFALYDEIITIFLERLHITVPSLDSDLLATGVLDSLALVELLSQLDTRYGIRLSLERLDCADFRSVQTIAAFVARERKAS